MALPQHHPYRNDILRLVANWRVRIDLEDPNTFTDRETVMAYSQVFLDWEKKTQEQSQRIGEARGEERGRLVSHRSLLQRQLSRKLGALPDRLSAAINLLTTEPLETLAIDLLDFSVLTDLETWLLAAMRSQYHSQLLAHSQTSHSQTSHDPALSPETEANIQQASLEQLMDWTGALMDQIAAAELEKEDGDG